MATKDQSKVVCVTGASGFIGSWLVRDLLERGYTVHATVQNLDDDGETKHLKVIDGAASHLHLFQIDLLDPTSIYNAIKGTNGVFHLASPFVLTAKDPQKDIVELAVQGTLNVLRAAKDCGIKRVILTSSTVAMAPNPHWPVDAVITEDCWGDVETLKKNELWYNLSKTLSEKAAWEFAENECLEMVVINPGMVLGPVLPSSLGTSIKALVHVLQGVQLDTMLDLKNLFIGCVDVRDVTRGMILLYENPSAKGRHLCEESIIRWADFVDKVAELFPEYPVKRALEDKQTWLVRAEKPSKKLINLGIEFTSIDKALRDTVESLKSKGLI
ncbi:Dihydroflavonol-4-reductase [Rhynchospora pubera]|uniref:Dihydroflavonol-4-reductase n=1 Tax=Rhynchospora pubera TaxID=906938 RepID=A0AAV8C7J1_9POAL|nr:Dihydroflavonol-4-reductase [Rhynchospora pubera]